MFPMTNEPSNQTVCFFFFNDTATTEIYTLSLHDALPISEEHTSELQSVEWSARGICSYVSGLPIHVRPKRGVDHVDGNPDTYEHIPRADHSTDWRTDRSEEHTSELQSPDHLVCRLLLAQK